jgi:hypothetical protein
MWQVPRFPHVWPPSKLDDLGIPPQRLIRVAEGATHPRDYASMPGKVPKRPIRAPEVPVRHALPRPVAHLLCNHQVLRVVLDGLGKFPSD